MLLKIDSNGVQQWLNIYSAYNSGGNITKDIFVRTASDGGFVVAGSVYSAPTSSDFLLFKVDTSGSEIWSHTYGTTVVERVLSFVEADSNGYLLAGDKDYKYYALRTDAAGAQVWDYVSSDTGWFLDVAKSPDNSFVFHAGGNFPVVAKLSPTGTSLWNKTFACSTAFSGLAIDATTDGGSIVANTCGDIGSDYSVWIFKLDANGNVEW
jgi:hypothetical protein